jgi:protease-4
VIASFDSLAASGGYYVAVATDMIVTNPGSLTGSIGVIMDFANLGELYKWAKVERYNLKSGKFKDTGNETRAMTPEEKELMQTLIDNVYGQFVAAVAVGRKMSEEKVRELADGRVYTGDQAVKLGLADKLGGMEVAVEEMKELAKIKGKPNLIYPEPKRKKFLDMIVDGLSHGIVDAVSAKLGFEADAEEGVAIGKKSGKSLFFL